MIFRLTSPIVVLTVAMNAATELELEKEVAFTLLIVCVTLNEARVCPGTKGDDVGTDEVLDT